MTMRFQEAIAYVRAKRVVLPKEFYGSLQKEARSQAFSIAGVSSRRQLQGVLDALDKSLSEGMTFKEWKESVAVESLGLPEYRLNNIYRTNIQCAYNRGHWLQQVAHKDQRPYLMYDAVNDSRTRPSHAALDNIIKPIDDPFWDVYYPPNGYKCRCVSIALTEKQARTRGGVADDDYENWPQPDDGWDYHPGKDAEQGISSSDKTKPGDNERLKKAQAKLKQELTKTLERDFAKHKTAVQDTIKEWLGKQGAKTVSDFSPTTIPLLLERAWDASVMASPANTINVVGSDFWKPFVTVYGVEPLGLYTFAERRINLNQRFAKSAQAEHTVLHELGHHFDYTVMQRSKMKGTRELMLSDYYGVLEQIEAMGVEARKFRMLPGDMKADVLSAAGVRTISTYALVNENEWIAEAFHMYHTAPSMLQLVAPKTFEAFERVRSGEAFK